MRENEMKKMSSRTIFDVRWKMLFRLILFFFFTELVYVKL